MIKEITMQKPLSITGASASAPLRAYMRETTHRSHRNSKTSCAIDSEPKPEVKPCITHKEIAMRITSIGRSGITPLICELTLKFFTEELGTVSYAYKSQVHAPTVRAVWVSALKLFTIRAYGERSWSWAYFISQRIVIISFLQLHRLQFSAKRLPSDKHTWYKRAHGRWVHLKAQNKLQPDAYE